MKDKYGIVLQKGDCINVSFDQFLDQNDIKVVFDSITAAGDLMYFPINTVGLSLIKYLIGEPQTGMYRTMPFTINSIQEHQLTILDPGHLNSTDSKIYKEIIQRLV